MGHFNVFLARLLLWLMFAGGVFAAGGSMLLSSIGVCKAACDYIAFPVATLVLAGAVILDGRKRRFSPVIRRTDRTIRYMIGHILVAIANLVLAMAFAFGPVAAFITHKPEDMLLVFYAIPAIVPYALGVYMIGSSKA